MSNIEEIQSIIVSWFNYAFYSQVWQKNQQEMFDSLRERGLPVKLGVTQDAVHRAIQRSLGRTPS